jgi:short-subunit dehydrogenase
MDAASAVAMVSEYAESAWRGICCTKCWTEVLLVVSLISFATFIVLPLLELFYWPQDLKKKYSAEWAVVTGASSGIGKAISQRLAEQGLNVVLAAMEDDLLINTQREFSDKFPDQEFRSVGVNLAAADHSTYMDKLIAATADLDAPQIIFSNAGFIRTGFFGDMALGAHLANHHCNATAAVPIVHHFLSRLRDERKKGCIVMTSSPAGFMACPFSCMYGATKAFVTEFAMSLAPEVLNEGIDVAVIHPSPVASNFFKGAHSLDAINFFKNTAQGPFRVADKAMACIGRMVVIDQGYYPTCVRLLLKIIDVNFLTEIIARTVHLNGDYKSMHRDNQKNAAPPTTTTTKKKKASKRGASVSKRKRKQKKKKN